MTSRGRTSLFALSLCATAALAVLFACGRPLPAASQPSPRRSLSLAGEWQARRVATLESAPPVGGWRPQAVPGTLAGTQYEQAWFRRGFTVPAEWRGMRVKLRFGGVKYNARVLVNGNSVGGCLNGYDPFEFDITDVIRFDTANDLAVAVQDWTATFSPGEEVELNAALPWLALRNMPRDRVISPLGGLFSDYGIWNEVALRAVPPVHLSGLRILPSIAGDRLTVVVDVLNEDAQPYSGAVRVAVFPWDKQPRGPDGMWTCAGKFVTGAASPEFRLAPGERRAMRIVIDQPGLEPWWPHDPRLYVLEASLGARADVRRERFGWRQLETRGGDFYLNGRKTHLLASSSWPPGPAPFPSDLREQLLALKRMNATIFRTHTQPWPDTWYEAADEIGLMMMPEGAVWYDAAAYAIDDPAFWENFRRHLESMVESLGNHPSVVMWSLENEFATSRIKAGSPNEERLADLAHAVRRLDPSRPLLFESDGDPGGAADVIGVHYPNEPPGCRLWPQDANWIDTPRGLTGKPGPGPKIFAFGRGDTFLWDRTKPLYVGEYHYMGAPVDPTPYTVFLGDTAYRDLWAGYRDAKVRAWRMQMHAYRVREVSGHCPWTVVEMGPLDASNPCWVAQRDLYRPLAAFVREYDARFFAGEQVERTVDLFNDTLRDLRCVEFDWALYRGDRAIRSGREAFAMPSGDHRVVQLVLKMPEIERREELRLVLRLRAEGVEDFSETWPLSVHTSDVVLAVRRPLVLCDPGGALSASMRRAGVRFSTLSDPEQWDGAGLLVLAPGALAETVSASVISGHGGGGLRHAVQRGGRVLVLEYGGRSSPGLPGEFTGQNSTLAFPQLPSHPVLAGMGESDFRWWRGDGIVSRNEPLRPSAGGGRALVVTGSWQGIAHAPLVEVPEGDGVWLVCQMAVAEKLESEPIARQLLKRMLDYLDAYQPPVGRTVIAAPNLEKQLGKLGVDANPVRDWSEVRYPDVGLLIYQGDGRALADNAVRLRKFLTEGGRLLWHRPTATGLAAARGLLPCAVTLQPQPSGVRQRCDGEAGVEFIAREDLFWPVRPANQDGFQFVPACTGMIDGILIPDRTDTLLVEQEAERGGRRTGPLLHENKGKLDFYTNAAVTWTVDLPATEGCVIEITAAGTPAAGEFPSVEIRLDSQPVGAVTLNRREPGRYLAYLPPAGPGPRELSLAFVNDLCVGGEDRNLQLDRWRIYRLPPGAAFSPLISPSGLVLLPYGKGAVILDALRWDEAGAAFELQARRLLAGILSLAGARFSEPPLSATLDNQSWRVTGPAVHRNQDGIAFYSGGSVGQEIMITTPGRYRIEAIVRGQSAGGEAPVAEITLDSRVVGRIRATGQDWRSEGMVLELSAGTHTLAVSFVNDYYKPPEDRNLWLRSIAVLPQ